MYSYSYKYKYRFVLGGEESPPNIEQAVQWLGDTFVGGDGVWRQEDKTVNNYHPSIHSSIAVTDGTSTYGDSSYRVTNGTVIAIKGRFKSFGVNNIIGSLDTATNRRFYFGTTSDTSVFTFGVGTSSTASTVSTTTEMKTYILCNLSVSARVYILPFDTPITEEGIIDIINNQTPDITKPAFAGTSSIDFRFGGATSGSSDFFAAFEHYCGCIMNFDGTDVTEERRWSFGEYGGNRTYDKIGTGDDIMWNTDTIWELSEYQRPNNLLDGCDVWTDGSELYVPFDVNGVSIKTDGDTITGYLWDRKLDGTVSGHNSCETVYKQPVELELQTIASGFTVDPWYSGGVPIYVDYNTILYNYENVGIWLADVLSKVPIKFNWIVYDPIQTNETLIDILIYLNSVEQYLTSEGEPYQTADGSDLYVLKEGL